MKKKKNIIIELILICAILNVVRGGNMKFVFKRLKLMIDMYINVKNDKYRKNELLKSFAYLFKHPYLFFVSHKHIECNQDSVLKNVNAIVNRPYIMSVTYESI